MTSYFNGTKAGLCWSLKAGRRRQSSDSRRICSIARLFIYLWDGTMFPRKKKQRRGFQWGIEEKIMRVDRCLGVTGRVVFLPAQELPPQKGLWCLKWVAKVLIKEWFVARRCPFCDGTVSYIQALCTINFIYPSINLSRRGWGKFQPRWNFLFII